MAIVLKPLCFKISLIIIHCIGLLVLLLLPCLRRAHISPLSLLFLFLLQFLDQEIHAQQFINYKSCQKLSQPIKIMTDTQTLRKSILIQSDSLGTKKRFGLFSHPVSTAIGDDGAYAKRHHPRDPASNKPLTMPRNFCTSPPKSGQYFGHLNPLASSHIKDEFIQPGKRLLLQQKQKRQNDKHQVSFFTGTGNKLLSKSSYEYIQNKQPQLSPRRNREDDGKVKSQPKNFYTNPSTKIENTLFKHPKHLDDPYDREAKIQKERLRKNKSLEGESKFRPNSFHPQVFNSNMKIYMQDVELSHKSPKQQKLNIYNHQSAWRSSSPNKKGLYGYFEPFPVYKQNPVSETKRKPHTQKIRDSFKLNNPQKLSTPSCSITLHRTNMRKSLK